MSILNLIDEYDDHYCKADTDDFLTNFAAVPLQVYCDAEAPDRKAQYVRFEVKVNEVGAFTVMVDASRPEVVNQILNQIPDAVFIIKGSAERLLEAYIRSRISQAASTSPGLYFSHSGLIRLGGSDHDFAFVAGDKVICVPPDTELHIAEDIGGANLCADETVGREKAAHYICELIAGLHAVEEARKKKRDKAGEEAASVLIPVWSYTILSFLRSEINQLNLTTFPALLLCGQAGTGKTTTANRLSLLYGQSEGEIGCIDAGSTAASTIKTISQLRDQVVMIDDLARSTSSKEERDRQNYVADLIRYIANNTPNLKCRPGNTVDERLCRVGCVFTGEYLDMSVSEIERLVIVHMDKRMAGGSPTDRSMAGTALHHFLDWVLPDLREHLEELNRRLTACDGMENPRLQKTGEMLFWAYQLYLKFACDIGAINSKERESLVCFGKGIISDHIGTQIRLSETKRLSNSSKPLAYYILGGYNTGALHTVKKKKAQKYQDSYVEDDALYIPANILLDYLKTTPYAYLGEKTLGKQLRDDGLLPTTKEGRTASKGKDGARWIRLELSTLREKAK